MKIACALITHLPAKAELRRHAVLRGRPVIVTARSGEGPLVLDASPQLTGVAAGMPLQQALSRCKEAVLLEADEPYYQMTFDEIVEALLRRSPIVEKGPLGCAYVGVSGLEDMYGGETRVVTALLNALPEELVPRVGLAESKFPAYVAAVRSEGGRATRVPEDVRGFLAGLPVDLLPLSWESRVRLHQFGLHTIGQVASLPTGAVQAQLGPEGAAAWELANGIDRRPLVPFGQEPRVSEGLTFPSPAGTLHAVLLALETLLGRAFAHPGLKGRYVRSASIEARILNRSPWTKSFAFKEAVGNKDRAFIAMRGALERATLPGALEDMRLTLYGSAGESGIQGSLLSDVRKRAQLGEAMRQLEARLRARPPIYRVMDLEPWSRLPERRQALVQFEP